VLKILARSCPRFKLAGAGGVYAEEEVGENDENDSTYVKVTTADLEGLVNYLFLSPAKAIKKLSGDEWWGR